MAGDSGQSGSDVTRRSGVNPDSTVQANGAARVFAGQTPKPNEQDPTNNEADNDGASVKGSKPADNDATTPCQDKNCESAA